MLRRFCVAPMMGRTDRHERYFLRKLSSRAFLYTEMVHANAVITNSKLLKYNTIIIQSKKIPKIKK